MLRAAAMGLRVLNASGAQGREWSERVAGLPASQRDLHFLPEYARIYERTYGYSARLAVYGDDSRYVLQPFVERPLNGLPFLVSAAVSDAYVDIGNPYGYGGPALSVSSEEDIGILLSGFERAFLEHCGRSRYASEFTSLHPRLGNTSWLARYARIHPELQKEVVYIDLAPGRDAMWRELRKGHKSSIGKARRRGAGVERIAPSDESVVEFDRLYRETMRRNQAQERWLFPDGYFRYCFDELGDDGASLFVVKMDGIVAAASILIHAFDTAYYHFSASDPRYHEHGVGTQLVFEMACWASEHGYRWMHLGGGVSSSPDDTLFRFKAGFSPLRAELYSYGRVLHDASYRKLCELKQRFELATQGRVLDSDYFPMYRR